MHFCYLSSLLTQTYRDSFHSQLYFYKVNPSQQPLLPVSINFKFPILKTQYCDILLPIKEQLLQSTGPGSQYHARRYSLLKAIS